MPYKKKSHHVGVKLLAVGAATVGMYLLYGAKHAKANRKKVKSWMIRARAEALEQAEKLGNLNRSDYERLVKTIEAKYKKLKNVDQEDLAHLAHELRGHWKNIEHEFKGGKKKKK